MERLHLPRPSQLLRAWMVELLAAQAGPSQLLPPVALQLAQAAALPAPAVLASAAFVANTRLDHVRLAQQLVPEQEDEAVPEPAVQPEAC